MSLKSSDDGEKLPNTLLLPEMYRQIIIIKNKYKRDKFLHATNSNGIMTRPIWKLMNKLPMYKNSQSDDLINSEWLYERVVNIPSSVTK